MPQSVCEISEVAGQARAFQDAGLLKIESLFLG